MKVRLTTLAVLLVLWWIASQFATDLTVPSPFLVMENFTELMSSGALPRALRLGANGLILGGALSFVIGIPIGIFMGVWRPAALMLEHYLVALYVMPMAAVVPLFMLWFGYELSVRVLFVLIFTVPQIGITCYEGAKNIPSDFIDVARAFRGNKQDIFFKVIIPFEIPFIITAVRLGVGRAIQGMVVAELLLRGWTRQNIPLGGLIARYAARLDTANILAIILFIMVLGIAATALVRRFENAIAPWREGMVAGSGE